MTNMCETALTLPVTLPGIDWVDSISSEPSSVAAVRLLPVAEAMRRRDGSRHVSTTVRVWSLVTSVCRL